MGAAACPPGADVFESTLLVYASPSSVAGSKGMDPPVVGEAVAAGGALKSKSFVLAIRGAPLVSAYQRATPTAEPPTMRATKTAPERPVRRGLSLMLSYRPVQRNRALGARTQCNGRIGDCQVSPAGRLSDR
jgi:hypothetical protein